MEKPVALTTTKRKKFTVPVDKFLPFLIPIIVILLNQTKILFLNHHYYDNLLSE